MEQCCWVGISYSKVSHVYCTHFSSAWFPWCDSLSRGLRDLLKWLWDKKNLGKSTQNNELVAIFHAVKTWHRKLVWRFFQMKLIITVEIVFRTAQYHPLSNINWPVRCVGVTKRSYIIKELWGLLRCWNMRRKDLSIRVILTIPYWLLESCQEWLAIYMMVQLTQIL